VGHDCIQFGDRAIVLHDTWIEVIRGLIVRHADPTPQMRDAFHTFVDGWIRIGPGVWMGDAFDGFVTGEDTEARRTMLVTALDAAGAAIAAQGDALSVEFLDAIPRHEVYDSGGFGEAVASAKILDALDRARALLAR